MKKLFLYFAVTQALLATTANITLRNSDYQARTVGVFGDVVGDESGSVVGFQSVTVNPHAVITLSPITGTYVCIRIQYPVPGITGIFETGSAADPMTAGDSSSDYTVDKAIIVTGTTSFDYDVGMPRRTDIDFQSKPVWIDQGDAATAAVTVQTFRQGVDLTVQAINEMSAKLPPVGSSSSGGGGGGSNAEAVAAEQIAEASAKPSSADDLANANSAATAAADQYVTDTANLTVFGGFVLGNSTTPDTVFDIHVPGYKSLTGNETVSVSPDMITGVVTIMDWVKLLISIFVIYWFELQVINFLNDQMKTGTVMRQAHGNTVAGSGGWITAALSAAAMTVFLTALPLLIAAHMDDSFTAISSIFPHTSPASIDAPSGDTWAAAGWWLINKVIPCDLITTVLLQYLFLKRYAGYLYVYCGTFIRWMIT